MIEVAMVNRMIKRGAALTPFLVALLWLAQGPRWGISAGVGMALALGNLFLAARVIGGVAQHSPQLLLPAGMVAFALGLALLVAVGFALQRVDAVDFPVMGITLVVAHLVLVLWEAPTAYRYAATNNALDHTTADLRS